MSQATIRGVVLRHLRGRIDLDDDTPLISSGLIDSMSLVDLILDLEHATGVRLTPAAIEVEDFESLARIRHTVERLANQIP